MTQRLSRLEAVVLGLLVDEPAHGYALRQRIAPGLPRGAQINDGVLYPLLDRLERRALLRATEFESGGRPRRVLSATPAGREAFLDWLRSDLDELAPIDHDLYLDSPFLKLLFADHLTDDERLRKLDNVERSASERLAALERLAATAPRGGFGVVGDAALELGREHERRVRAAAARLRAIPGERLSISDS